MKYEDPIIDESIHGNANVAMDSPLSIILKLGCALVVIFVTIYLLLVLFVNQAVTFISLETERRWFGSLSQSMMTFYDVENTSNQKKSQQLQKIADNLIKAELAKNPNSTLKDVSNVRVYYADDDMVNAFATPGGNIFIMRGLIEAMPNENALAMVIAHEIAHVVNRDSIKALGTGILSQVALSALFGSVANYSLSFINLKHSRNTEQNADELGLNMLYSTYGNAYGSQEIFQQLTIKSKENKWMQLASTHPLSQKRIDTMQKQIDTHKLLFDKNKATPMPKILTAENLAK